MLSNDKLFYNDWSSDESLLKIFVNNHRKYNGHLLCVIFLALIQIIMKYMCNPFLKSNGILPNSLLADPKSPKTSDEIHIFRCCRRS